MNGSAVPSTTTGKSKKIALQLLLGMAAGAGGMFAAFWFLEDRGGMTVEPERAAAVATAMVFGLMALFVGLGTLAPSIGARTLNVEDRDELSEQRSVLLIGAVSFLLVALLLGALALSGREENTKLLTSESAGLTALLSGLGLVGWAFLHRDKGDEMMRAATKEAGALTTNLLFLVFGSWAAAAHLGLAPMFDPLLFVSGLFALYLLAVFIAAGRRGLLKPR